VRAPVLSVRSSASLMNFRSDVLNPLYCFLLPFALGRPSVGTPAAAERSRVPHGWWVGGRWLELSIQLEAHESTVFSSF
jgi:hypothetical protein